MSFSLGLGGWYIETWEDPLYLPVLQFSEATANANKYFSGGIDISV